MNTPAEALNRGNPIQLQIKPLDIEAPFKGGLDIRYCVIAVCYFSSKGGQSMLITLFPCFSIVKPLVEFSKAIHTGIIMISDSS